jgi:hypothetical protein
MGNSFPFNTRDYIPRMSYPPRLPTALPDFRILVPHKIRRKWRATSQRLRVGQSPASNIFKLQTSFSPSDTIRALRKHQWSLYDFQYFGLAVLGIFCLCIIGSPGPGPMFKTIVATLLITSLVLPITRQFFLPFLPIIGWLVLFYSAK